MTVGITSPSVRSADATTWTCSGRSPTCSTTSWRRSRRRPPPARLAVGGRAPNRLVGRVGWWTRSANDPPPVLDFLDVSDADDGVRLVETAMRAVLPAVRRRRTTSASCRPTGHRTRCSSARSTSGGPCSSVSAPGHSSNAFACNGRGRPGARAQRAAAVPPGDRSRGAGRPDDIVLEGTLDAHSRVELTRMTPGEQANSSTTTSSPGTRRRASGGGWRRPMARRSDSSSRPATHKPDHRLHRGAAGFPWPGYVDDILAEGTRSSPHKTFRASGLDRCGQRADGARLRRAGYATFERQLDMTWS